ncbi:hypothetical protein FHETE_9633 [Fusarium heterosporum]|uniref:Uncharacterized protein n=1 Tax=Fusarium heterosporum TaxID=42747 RepID=A0A8H5SSD2_FUSHE|nr:hypothetical protein FHETE_9633 [Fusarium heterosporum]
MHSAIVALIAIAGLASATPTTQTECQGVGAYYVCGVNGFRGYCSTDPCDKKWCSDFVEKTCDPVFITTPPNTEESKPATTEEGHWEPKSNAAINTDDGTCAPDTGFYQVCDNGFKGCCKFDACKSKQPICPTQMELDIEAKSSKRDDTVCAPGTGFFQSCSNGFRGCCATDACSSKAPICPPKNSKRDETICPPDTGFFQSCSNGFRGCCKSDACGQKQPICPPTVTKRTDETVCPPGSGFFQSCSNGFRGCCKGDACAGSWCPDAQTLQVKVRAAANADGTCRPGTGFFQVCSNGFKGCCKKDACAGKRPVCPK